MKSYIVLSLPLLLSIGVYTAIVEDYSRTAAGDDTVEEFESFRAHLVGKRSLNQAKRDLSLSYSATDINSKEGTRVKTITVIKNINKNGELSINPALHRNHDWGTKFRENFHSYGSIPDVPDIDHLFEFVNKKYPKSKDNDGNRDDHGKKTEVIVPKSKEVQKEVEKPVVEYSSEIDLVTVSEETTSAGDEKIKDDDEPLPSSSKLHQLIHSQSLSANKKSLRESIVNENHSTPQHPVHQFLQNYVQFTSDKGDDCRKSCAHTPPSSRNDETTSPPSRNDETPSIARKLHVPMQQKQLQPQQRINSPNYSSNSLSTPIQLPPRSQAPSGFSIDRTATSRTSFASTSQHPYVAPNHHSGLSGLRRGPSSAAVTIYRNVPSSYQKSIFGGLNY